MALPKDTRLMILAPVVQNRKGEHLELFEQLQAQGFVRVRIRSEGSADGSEQGADSASLIHELDQVPELNRSQKHSIDVVVDRLKVNDGIRQRLAESLETEIGRAHV